MILLKYNLYESVFTYGIYMKKIYLVLLALIALVPCAYGYQITALFFDVESIFQTDSMKASSYVGKINSLRYLSHVGNLPCQADLFNQLKTIKAQSTQVTYNNNLEMPLILSDWLTQQQPSSKIKDIIQRHFTNKNLSDIEIKVLTAVISMMLTPQHLADTQKVRSKIENMLQALKQKGYKLYLVGNWAHISSMKSEFPEIFRYFNGTFMSGDIHLLKPSQQYYQYVFQATGIHPSNALWIEPEMKFRSKVEQYGYNVFEYKADDYRSLISGLNQFGVSI